VRSFFLAMLTNNPFHKRISLFSVSAVRQILWPDFLF